MLKKLFRKKDQDKTESYKAYLAEDINKYKPNEYVVFGEDGVFDHGEDLGLILEEFKTKFPEQNPFVYKVPPKKFVL